MEAEQVKNNISLRYRLVGYICNANDVPSYHIPIILFYGKANLGLSFSQTILIFYGIGFLTSLAEIPAGAFGDKYGRKLSYLMSIAMMLIGYSIWLYKLPIIFYVIGSLLIGAGNAFRSGSISSMIYEEYSIEKKSDRYHVFQSYSLAWYYGVRLFAMPIGAYLYTINHKLPMYMTLVSIFMCGILVLLISDKNITPEHHNARSLFSLTIKQVWNTYEIRILCILVFVAASYGNIIWRLFQPSYSFLNLDVKNIGWFYSIFAIAGIIGSLRLGKISDKRKLFKLILIYFIFTWVTYIITAIYFNIGTVAFSVFAISFFFPLSEAAATTYLQHKFERFQQATIMSIISFLFWIGLNVGDLIAGVSNSYLDVKQCVILLIVIGAIIICFITAPILKNMKPDELVISEN